MGTSRSRLLTTFWKTASTAGLERGMLGIVFYGGWVLWTAPINLCTRSTSRLTRCAATATRMCLTFPDSDCNTYVSHIPRQRHGGYEFVQRTCGILSLQCVRAYRRQCRGWCDLSKLYNLRNGNGVRRAHNGRLVQGTGRLCQDTAVERRACLENSLSLDK